MTAQLQLINTLAAEGRTEFTFQDAVQTLGASSTATANALSRLSKQGLIDHVARGCYVIRPMGSLGTSAASADLGIAVAAAFGKLTHRIAYTTALSELGLLRHPVRTVFVACEKQIRSGSVSQRPLRVVIERRTTILLETETVERSNRSTLERALLECAMRLDLVGGVERLAEALVAGAPHADTARIVALADHFAARGAVALRRLASLARALNIPGVTDLKLPPHCSVTHLDPRADETVWVDHTVGIAWNIPADELRAVVEQ